MSKTLLKIQTSLPLPDVYDKLDEKWGDGYTIKYEQQGLTANFLEVVVKDSETEDSFLDIYHWRNKVSKGLVFDYLKTDMYCYFGD